MKLFSPDSTFMRTMTTLSDLILLNLLTIIFSIPIFTSGAAAAALYTVMGRMVRHEDYAVSEFFRAFKDNFKQATTAWLIMLLPGVALIATFLLADHFSPSTALIIEYVVGVLAIIWLITYSWAFPVISQFDNKASRSLINALQFGIGHFPRSIGMCVLNALPWVLLFYDYTYFLRFFLIWLIVWFAAAAYFCALLTRKPFAPYRNDEPAPVDSDEPVNTSSYVPTNDVWAAFRGSYGDDLAPEDEDTDDRPDYDDEPDDLTDEDEFGEDDIDDADGEVDA